VTWAPTATPTPVRGVPHPFGPVRPPLDPATGDPATGDQGLDESDSGFDPADDTSTGTSAPPEPAPWSLVPRRERPRVYVDGSALSRYLAGAPSRDAWLAWAAEHEDRLVTTFLGVSELRRVARPRGVEAHGVAHDVTDRVEVVRFSDQSLHAAARVASVLPSFVALHVGAAVAHVQVGAVATYDLRLAQVAVLHGLEVVSPGWPTGWWERPTPSS
jgi:predicted nucleic acid-binding protein